MKLQTKFLTLLLSAGLLAAAVVLLLIQRSVHSIIIGGLEQSSIVLALASMHDLAPGMETGSERDLLPALQKLQREQDALYAAALDQNGKVLAHTTVTEKGRTESDEFTCCRARGSARAGGRGRSSSPCRCVRPRERKRASSGTSR